MANFEVPENPEFTEDIRKLETTDPGHANIFNAVFEPIINNVLHVKKMITDHMMAKNPHGIKPADLGLENVENKPMGELSTEFTVAGTRSNIQSGQAMKTILGMLSRWYTDLKTVAWSGKYNDLTDKPTIPNGAAASCAVANNDTTTAAGSVADARIVRQHGLEIDEINRDLNGYQFDVDEKGNALAQYTFDGKIKTVNLGGGAMTLYGLYGKMDSTGTSNTISIPVTNEEEYTIVIWIDTYAGTSSVLSSMTGATVLSTISERNFNNALNKSWVHIKRIKATSDTVTITGTMGSSYSNVVWAALFTA